MLRDLPHFNSDPEAWKLVRSHPILRGITDEEVTGIAPFFHWVVLQPDEILFEEGVSSSMDLYLILEGTLAVIKYSADRDGLTAGGSAREHFTIAKLSAGDAIGELSFIRGDPRSASIKSSTSAILLGLDPKDLTQLEVEYPRVAGIMMKNMVGYVSDRLKQTSANEVKALKIELQNSILNSQANLFFSYVIGLLCVYNLTIHLITNLSMDANQASIISALIIVIFSSVLILMIRQSKLGLEVFGLTTRNWRPALKESLAWSAAIILICVGIKWILILEVPRYSHLPLFDFDLHQKRFLTFNFILYGLHSPLQEFIARGVLQGSLQHFFTGKNVTLRAIIVSNALFSATHVHLLSGLLGIIVFVPGLFWGWLYARQGNLIGISVSHILIGWSALFFLNLESLF